MVGGVVPASLEITVNDDKTHAIRDDSCISNTLVPQLNAYQLQEIWNWHDIDGTFRVSSRGRARAFFTRPYGSSLQRRYVAGSFASNRASHCS